MTSDPKNIRSTDDFDMKKLHLLNLELCTAHNRELSYKHKYNKITKIIYIQQVWRREPHCKTNVDKSKHAF